MLSANFSGNILMVLPIRLIKKFCKIKIVINGRRQFFNFLLYHLHWEFTQLSKAQIVSVECFDKILNVCKLEIGKKESEKLKFKEFQVYRCCLCNFVSLSLSLSTLLPGHQRNPYGQKWTILYNFSSSFRPLYRPFWTGTQEWHWHATSTS